MRVFAPIATVARRNVRLAATLLALTGVAGCLDLNPNVTACSVTAAPAQILMSVGGVASLIGTAFDCKGNSIRTKTINYNSADPTVATVTIAGQVIAVGVGTTVVSAVADGKSVSVPVTVTPELPTSVIVNPPTATLRRGDTRQFAAVARNVGLGAIAGQTFRWNSSNTSIASVSSTGLVTALTAGTVNVTADVANVFGIANITVTERPIGSCTLTPGSFRVFNGQSVQPVLALRDTANGALSSLGRLIVWTSDNETVATVSNTGFVTTRRAGTARISAVSFEYPAVSCVSTVEAVDTRVAQVVITPRTGSLRIGTPRALAVTLLDSVGLPIGPGRVITWTTNTATVASVSQAGIVTGLSLGTARVIATSEGIADTVSFPVTRIPVSTITVSPLQATVIEGQSVQLTATVTDSVGTVITDRVVEWLTSDPSRATVSSTGRVSTIAPGNVNIFATTEGRSSTGASITIQQIRADTITVANAAVTVKVGTLNQTAFAFTVLDANGNILRNRTVVISNSAPGVVQSTTQTTAGQVQLLGLVPGSAVLTLQVLNSNNQAEGKATSVTVTVTP